MSAVPSLPAINWASIAPDEWQYLADLIDPLPPARPSGIVLRNRRDLAPGQREAIARAVRRECGRWIRVDNDDLTQCLTLRLLEFEAQNGPPEDLDAWLRPVARNLVADWLRTERLHRERLKERHESGAAPPYFGNRKRDPLIWYVATKPPPLVCGGNYVEDDTIGAIDARTEAKKDWRRDSVNGRDVWTRTMGEPPTVDGRFYTREDAERWTRKRTQTHHSIDDTQKVTRPIRVGSSSLSKAGT